MGFIANGVGGGLCRLACKEEIGNLLWQAAHLFLGRAAIGAVRRGRSALIACSEDIISVVDVSGLRWERRRYYLDEAVQNSGPVTLAKQGSKNHWRNFVASIIVKWRGSTALLWL
jgi:hypothetical protein